MVISNICINFVDNYDKPTEDAVYDKYKYHASASQSPCEYDKYGKGAPLERNKLIVDECDCVLAFWDGQSHGTKFTLDYAKEKNKPIKIVQI